MEKILDELVCIVSKAIKIAAEVVLRRASHPSRTCYREVLQGLKNRSDRRRSAELNPIQKQRCVCVQAMARQRQLLQEGYICSRWGLAELTHVRGHGDATLLLMLS